MFSPCDPAGLLQTNTTRAFIERCRMAVERSAAVLIHPERLDSLVGLIETAKPISWDWHLRMKDQPIERTFFDFAFNAALNGGYFKLVDGKVEQWSERGSGSAALVSWIERQRAEKRLPGIDLNDADAVCDMLWPSIEGLPHAAKRILICAEFSDHLRMRRLNVLLARVRQAGFQFTLADVDDLVRIYPASFGGDPFRKKAVLVFTMLSGFLESHGTSTDYDLPIPSDYQIPRILAWAGAIEIAPAFQAMLRDETRLLDVDSPEVTEFRAAAVVLAHELGRRAGRPDNVVDGALFTNFRKNPDFQRGALPPMRCDSLWF